MLEFALLDTGPLLDALSILLEDERGQRSAGFQRQRLASRHDLIRLEQRLRFLPGRVATVEVALGEVSRFIRDRVSCPRVLAWRLLLDWMGKVGVNVMSLPSRDASELLDDIEFLDRYGFTDVCLIKTAEHVALQQRLRVMVVTNELALGVIHRPVRRHPETSPSRRADRQERVPA